MEDYYPDIRNFISALTKIIRGLSIGMNWPLKAGEIRRGGRGFNRGAMS